MTAALAVVSVLLIGSWVLLVVVVRDHNAERARLIRAIISDTPQDLALLERAASIKPVRSRPDESEKPKPYPIGLA